MQITGIILAGGKSLRMGTDKALLQLKDKTLLEQAIEKVLPLCDTLLISSNNSAHKKFAHKVVPDEIKDCGPLGGIYTCLKQAKTNWNFVISVDSAFVEIAFLKYLISEIDNSEAVVPIHTKGKEPLIALYHKNCLTEMAEMLEAGNYKMHNLVNSINTKFVDSQLWIEKYPNLFRNLNRPEDLQ